MRRTRDRHSLPKQNRGHLTRTLQVAAIAAIISLLSAGIALADIVQNNVVVGGNDTITAGGSTTVSYSVQNTNSNNSGDPQNSCNPADGSPVMITLSVPDDVTASTESFALNACEPTKQDVLFSSSKAGTYSIEVATSDAGPGTYSNSANWTLKVNAPPAPSDTTPPVISSNVSGTLGNNDWYTSNVALSWTIEDDESAISSSSGCGPVNITADQAATTYTCSATSAGGTASQSVTIKRDAMAPTDVAGSPNRGPDSNGWYNAPVGFTFTGQDAPSGIASCSTPTYGGPDGEDVTASGSCSDNAGNQSAAVNSTTIDYDATDPTDIEFVGGPAAGSEHYFGSVPAAPTCSASDDTSGVASCVVTGYSSAVGTHTLTATATDNAGNSDVATRSYTVLAWTISGYYQPVDMGLWNTVKGGSTVPLKFKVFAGPTELTSTSIVKSFTIKSVTCPGASAPTDAIEFVTTGGTNLRYDTTGGQFIQNWQTPKKPGTCHSVTMETNDGSKISANFILK